ncbi:Generic methyltransferase [Zea mays]|uniref:Methyltransferase n=2 Tax=Zea mays TaxID=4577 RepID=A0A1D6HFU7_MAIZE|nr:Generic methyltransferase [Zea mays]
MGVRSAATKLHIPPSAARRPTFLPFVAVTLLCSASYLVGVWQHGGFASPSDRTAVSIATAVACTNTAATPKRRTRSRASSSSSGPPPLDFSTRHAAAALDAGTASSGGSSSSSSSAAPRRRRYPACPAKYSEYTPCEDVERSLRFPRDRLVYRERHCPASERERLRCLVPVPAGYDKMEACITPLPEVSSARDVAGGAVKKWPQRLTAVPPRVSRGTIKGVTARSFAQDTALWRKRVRHYKSVISQFEQKGRYRNVLDMNARLGGFAAALASAGDPLWVMNMVPTVGNTTTLGAIYERGLIGSYQDWCEGMSTYPRTYDLIHADSVFTLYRNRCQMDRILLEMDRILRPRGTVIIREDVDLLVKVKSLADGMRWESQIVDHEDGPLVREKILLVVKTYWTAHEAMTKISSRTVK